MTIEEAEQMLAAMVKSGYRREANNMTNEELKKMNVKQVADRFLSNYCGRCDDCELDKNDIEIGGTFITICHLMYSVLREDRKREDAKK